jgi:hypothetical protein
MAMVVLLLMMLRVILLVQMDYLLHIASFRHHKYMSAGMDHLYFRSVKP